MTRSIRGSRRMAALLAAAAATLLVSGCGAGQIAETALKTPTVPGTNPDLRTADGLFKVRNLLLAYPGVEGYPAGGNAVVEVAIFNESANPVTVTISSDSARSVVLTSTATPSPTAPTAPPGATQDPLLPPTEPAPAAEPARIEIPAYGYAVFSSTSARQLQLVGLNQAVRAGQSVNLVFDFNGQQLSAQAPVRVPLTPAPKPTPEDIGGGHS